MLFDGTLNILLFKLFNDGITYSFYTCYIILYLFLKSDKNRDKLRGF